MATTITDWTDLDNVRNDTSDDYILANDLDQNTSGYSGIGDDFDPIGDAFNTGWTLDGQGHAIRDLVVSSSKESIGLLGGVDVVTDLSVLGADIDATSGVDTSVINGAGVLIGAARDVTIERCIVSGTVTTTEHDTAGGLVGSARAAGFSGGTTVVDCASDVSVSGTDPDATGGFVGRISGSTVRRSYAFGSVDGGGFCGENIDEIRDSYAAASANGGSAFVADSASSGDEIDCVFDQVAAGTSQTDGSATNLGTTDMQGRTSTSTMPHNFGADFSPVASGENASADGYPILRRVAVSRQDPLHSPSISGYLPPLESLSATLQSGSVPPTDVSWSRLGETDATRLYRSDVVSPSFPSDFTQIDTLAGDADSVSDAAIVNDDTFTYRVTAVVDGTESQASNADDVTTVVPLESLSAVSADLDGPGVELSWTLNYTTLDAIEVYRTEGTGGTFPDDYTNTDTVGGSATDTEDTTVDAETDYTYRLTAAIDDVGESDPTAADTASLGSIGPFVVSITGTNSPVDSGETLEVTYDLENQGEFTGDASIDLEVTPQ